MIYMIRMNYMEVDVDAIQRALSSGGSHVWHGYRR